MLAPWKESFDQPRQHITLPTKVCLVKAVVFTVVVYGCESCIIKKAECQRTDAFELWCWRRLLPLDCKEIHLVHPKGDHSRLMLKLKLILWLLDTKNWLIGKDPDAGKDWRWEENGDDRGWDSWMASMTQWTWVWVNSGGRWWAVLRFMGLERVRTTEWLNWTELNWTDPSGRPKDVSWYYLCFYIIHF